MQNRANLFTATAFLLESASKTERNWECVGLAELEMKDLVNFEPQRCRAT